MRRTVAICCLGLIGCGGSAPEVKPPVAEVEAAPRYEDLPQEFVVALSDRAAERIRELARQEPERDKLRLSVVEKFGGDLHWQTTMVGRVDEFDDETFVSRGITIVIDRSSRPFVRSAKVDYDEGRFIIAREGASATP